MKARDRLILIIVVAFGFAMRAPITVVPLIIDQLARGLHASVSNLGILTTIPLVMFLSFSVVAAKEMTRFGLHKTLNFGLAALLAGACLFLADDLAWHGAGWLGDHPRERVDAISRFKL